MLEVGERIEREIAARLKSGDFASVEELLDRALKALDSMHEYESWVEQELLKALESGPPHEVTDETWEEIEREALAQLKARRGG